MRPISCPLHKIIFVIKVSFFLFFALFNSLALAETFYGGFLKQSTSATLHFGPFVDETDGYTAETGLTISQSDIKISKNGAALATKNDSGNASHDSLGHYSFSLNTTDTGTLGKLKVAIHESGARPIVGVYDVVPANIYDSLVAGTDTLRVDATLIEGVDATNQMGDSVWDEAMAGHISDGTFGGDFVDVDLIDPTATVIADIWGEVGTKTDVATGNTATSFTLTAGATVNDAYNNMILVVEDAGDGNIEARRVSDYTSGRVVTVDTAYSFTPAVADKVWILGSAYASASQGGTVDANIVQIAGDAIVDNNDGRLEVNVEEIADVAVNTASAQLGVNVVQIEAGDATDALSAATPTVTLANGAHGGAAATITLSDYSNFKATGFSTHGAADVVNEWESQSQADPTGFHVNVKEVNGTGQTANDNGADINDILTDTNELQTNQNWDVWDDYDRQLTAIDEDVTTMDLDTTTVAGGGVTAQQVWEYTTRTLTELDEDNTTIDLDSTALEKDDEIEEILLKVTRLRY